MLIFQFVRAIFSGRNTDFSKAIGKPTPAVIYSLTGAMSPAKKETAYLHLPTYTAGIFFHLGIFLSFIILGLNFFNVELNEWGSMIGILMFMISGFCGIMIFAKRIINGRLRRLSYPDDYFSNMLVTGFQLICLVSLIHSEWQAYLFIYGSILFLYIPFGKLKHIVYFFAARVHLGIFFGKRGVWPLSIKR